MGALILVACLLSFSTAWADFYADHIYVFLRDISSPAINILPFPVGELLMYLGAILIVAAVIILLLLIFLRKKKSYVAFATAYFKSLLIVILSVLLIYSTQWLTPYRSSVLGRPEAADHEYTLEEMRVLYIYVIESLNEACLSVPRDAEGYVIYDTKNVTEQKVATAMNGISDEFPRLRGYYPPFKEAWCSDVLEWMWIGGYTYPYTMEVTCNKYIGKFYFPTLYAHECSHHMGYYKEHEANFLSYLACSSSEDPVLRYSAFYYIYSYVDESYYEACVALGNEDLYWEDDEAHPILPQVRADVRNSLLEAEEVYQSDEHVLEDFADEAAEISDVGWETQAEILQEYNYDGVVYLMLQYYFGN
ncbi:MAG: DUF3810 domain-containing protein [Lachnospiraceae bacterium]|nr:DUF3810 domain-containing protein [Lachnospiraceae bacterium]